MIALKGLNPGREVFDRRDRVPGELGVQPGLKVKPPARGAFQGTKIQIERINVGYGFHAEGANSKGRPKAALRSAFGRGDDCGRYADACEPQALIRKNAENLQSCKSLAHRRRMMQRLFRRVSQSAAGVSLLDSRSSQAS